MTIPDLYLFPDFVITLH